MSTSLHEPITDDRAYSEMVEHHTHLRGGLETLLTALRDAAATGHPCDHQRDALVAFLNDEILPHALAEEVALYPVGAAHQGKAFIETMMRDHRYLAARTRVLANTQEVAATVAIAGAISAVFALHVEKENDILLPTLLKSDGVSLAALLQQMHDGLTDAAGAGAVAASADTAAILDVRTLPHGGARHEVIFGRLAQLDVRQTLTIENDHDPKPLHYQLDAAWPDRYSWEYLQAGPQLWRIAITRQH
ncbi:MAG: DUF2249 domain-containing protein [Acidothermaceae bacterium]